MKKILILLLVSSFSGFVLQAQEVKKAYFFNTADKSTHTISCGNLEPQGWAVIRNSCNFYTPVTGVGGNAGEEDRIVDLKIRIGNSGNLDAKDFAWLFYYVNGKMVLTRTFKGDNTPQSFDFTDSIYIPAGGNYKIRLALVCDEQDEYWRLMNGDLTAQVRMPGEAPAETDFKSLSHDPGLVVVRERNIARLSWSAPPDPDANHFIIEKSRDGEKFEFAAYLRNDNDNMTKYSYIDHDLFKPQTWYRVTRVGVSGKKSVIGAKVKLPDE